MISWKLEFYPQGPYRKSCADTLVIPALGRWGQADLWGLLTRWPSLLSELQTNKRQCLKALGDHSWVMTPRVDLWPLCMTSVCTHVPTYTYTYTQKDKEKVPLKEIKGNLVLPLSFLSQLQGRNFLASQEEHSLPFHAPLGVTSQALWLSAEVNNIAIMLITTMLIQSRLQCSYRQKLCLLFCWDKREH